MDTFRHLYPDVKKFSWFSYRGGARAKNMGWRLDYHVVNESCLPAVKDSKINNEQHGSDHCPVELDLVISKLV